MQHGEEQERVNRVFNAYAKIIEHTQITVNTDNKNVENILNIVNRKMKPQNIATSMHSFCETNSTDLTAKWIPRTHNKHADDLSRIPDLDNWEISLAVFQFFNDLWGTFTSDIFATHYNTHFNISNSRFWCSKTEAIDLSTQFWGHDLNWLVPPPVKVAMTIHKMRQDHAKGTLLSQNGTDNKIIVNGTGNNAVLVTFL